MQEADKGSRIFRCVLCQGFITRVHWRTSVNGAHSHTFCNPHGLVFEIGCFSDAPGCALAGPVSQEFSWFPGHAWRVAMCKGCSSHMGWGFYQGHELRFHGLILDMLEEVEEDGGA